MKVSTLKTEQRTDLSWNRQYNIVAYGKNNDQPQKWREVVAASGTASNCVRRFKVFINGRGFSDKNFYKLVVNESGMTADKLLRRVCDDVSFHSGFCLHVNYSLSKKIEVNYVPFETVRFYWDDAKKRITKFAIHPDWGRRNESVIRFTDTKITYIDFYNPDPKVISEQVKAAGGWDKWNGQLLYCSMAGELIYPTPVYDCVISDMSSEDAIASVKNRNSKNNFLPAGMLVTKKKQTPADTEDNRESEKFNEEFKVYQGAENACKLIHVECDYDEEEPKFVPFPSKNFDKEFDYSEKSAQQNIGKAFMQPAVLRGEMIAGKLGSSTEIKDATDFYNSVTEFERIWVEENFAIAFDGFLNLTADSDFSILPVEYKVSEPEKQTDTNIIDNGSSDNNTE
ncbi:MAG: hypothetical protein WC341_16050 [Bacteroidales bacterium]|jgi:hypothetical protein